MSIAQIADSIQAFFEHNPDGETSYAGICSMCGCTEDEARRGLSLARKKRGLTVESYLVFKHKNYLTNPWGLTPREEKIMTTICSLGGHKQAARRLGIAHSTIKDTTSRIGMKMDMRFPATAKYIAWDRWQREQQK
jgi:DNA-binding NarL/FixJ family response regulator